MPRSSRHKSHKQHKHSSKEAREYSDSEEVVNRKDREEVVVRVSKESGSSEKRKLVSQSVDGNGEEYSSSKRRKERSDGTGGDRWNGGGGGNSVVDKETKKVESSEKGLKSKIAVDSKSSSKSSRRRESSSEKKEVNPGLVAESEEVKRSSNSSKSEKDCRSKSEKESRSKSEKEYKDSKEKEHTAERNSKAQDVRRERSIDKAPGKGAVDSEGSKKHSSHFEERPATKTEVGNTELIMQGVSRIPESEKDHEKRVRRKRDGSDEKEKYPEDIRDSNGRRLSTKDERQKDEKHKDDRYKDKYREDLDRDHRNRDDRVRDERSSKDLTSDRSDTRHSRDENRPVVENRHKKTKTQIIDHDGSPHILDERATRYKDYRGKKRSSDEEDRNDLRSRNSKEHRYEVEKKVNSPKVESLADRGRSQSRLADGDSILTGNRRKSSPSSGAYYPKDNSRQSSKQSELKYKDPVSEEIGRANVTSPRELATVSGIPERASESRSTDKPKSIGTPIRKDKNQLAELSSERSPVSDKQASSLQLKEKPHSSTSIDRRHSNRTPVRRSLDIDETGHRSRDSKEARDYYVNEDRGSWERPLEKPTEEEFSQADGDTVSVSSSVNRTTHLPTSSPSVLPPPPPFRTGVDSPSVYSSFEDDNRSKSSNRYRRSFDPNIGRGQGKIWKGVPNWPAPVTNGFIPFQQGIPHGGYHPMMQQFHGPMYGVRPSMEMSPNGVPYHIPDTDRYSGHGHSYGWRNQGDEACPPHLQGWDASNGTFRDEAHLHRKPDWDQSRHMMNDRGWETSADMWKGQNNGPIIDFPPSSRKEDSQLRDELWLGKPGQRSRNDRSRSVSREESIEIKISEDIPPEEIPTEVPKQLLLEKNPEPFKTLNDNSFCHVYLSKLDISADLAHPDLYKQYRSLLDMEGNINDSDITNEDFGKAGVKISKASLSAPLFPKIKDSVFQRAMALYKKQREEMRVKVPVSSCLGEGPKMVPTNNDGELLYPDPAIVSPEQGPIALLDEEKEKLIPVSTEVNVEEKVPALDNEKADEVITVPNHEKVEDSVPTSALEIAVGDLPYSDAKEKKDEDVPDACNEVVEPVPIVDSMETEDVPSDDHVEKVDTDAIKTANVDDMEVAEGLQSPKTNMEDITMACAGKSIIAIGSPKREAAFRDDPMCGFLGVTDGPEALAPMSIECKSVNLSRIHSPESTH